MSPFRRLVGSASARTVGLAAAVGAGVLYLSSNGIPKPKMQRPCQLQQTLPSQPQKSLGSRPAFAGSGFIDLTLESCRMVNHNTKELRFALPGDGAVSGLGPVSSLLTKHTTPGAWTPTFRPYTPVSSSDDTHVTLLVKRYPGGRASTHLHGLQPGETLSAKALPELARRPNARGHVLLVAGGAGITPLYQFLRASLRDPADATRLSLVYAAASDAELLLKPELDALAARHAGRFTATYLTVQPSRDPDVGTGYVTKDVLEVRLPSLKPDGVGVLGSLGGFLKDLGFAKDQVHKF